MHVVWDCEDVKEVWASILNPNYFSQFFSIGLEGWLHLNLSSQLIGTMHEGWQTLFGVMVYDLWKVADFCCSHVSGCADFSFLAKKGHESSSFDWVVFDSVCPSLGLLLANDVRGSVLPRVGG